ncbi:PREDICTED: EKC/KEOPS complex subunit TPRKB-like [Papilio polytes]|uniref:EKC/KEOPS complex subunit TPRKB-like n=1 Tax=Papilio polytes TaxID=76194 RepID=UPI0006765A57|nr:PREDICTED: EKC/KEOPS complex subunit TPRKB-like [Papilio polytes]
MSYDPYICNLDPETKTSLKVYLFNNVENVDQIRSNIMNGTWKCAAIKPSLILDLFQIAVAANKAVLAEKSQAMITRTVYAEILFNLSLSKNISQSLSKFGVETDRSLLVCFLITADSDESETILEQIKGELLQISDLKQFTNIQEVKSIYKLTNVKSDVSLLNLIITKIVTKSFIAH